ncbi:MAG: xylulokinase [Ilumatobacteraceae bacterium]
MSAVTGVDSSTQSCKVVVCDLETGAVLRSASAPHPEGTEVAPAAWEAALREALAAADGLGGDVVALGVGGQQHGMVTLDDAGEVVRDALLWNDTRSAGAAADLVRELGASAWADAVGSVPVASITLTKLRWLAEHEPDHAGRVAGVCLPHDWLTWRLGGATGLDTLTTDRGDASGTGYWSPAEGRYRLDLLAHGFGRELVVPRVIEPSGVAGQVRDGLALSAGTGDNMAAALGLQARPGDVIVSLGTSGVVSAVAARPSADATGVVTGFADATGHFLPLACTLNGAPVFATMAELLGVDLGRFSELALSAEPGAGGVVLVPYFAGERTPNLPDASAELVGLTLANSTPANIARAAIEGVLAGLADGIDALIANGAHLERVLLVGGGAKSEAVQRIAPTVFGVEVEVPEPAEYVALGAAWQAAWAHRSGADPGWPAPRGRTVNGVHEPVVRAQYSEAAARIATRFR